MGLDLFAKQVNATYDSLIKVGDNNTLTGTPKRLTDGRGNDSPIWLGTTRIGIGLIPETGIDLQTNIGKFGSVITTSLRIDGSLTDSLGSIGSLNQVLISTGSATKWVNLSVVSGVSGSGTTNTIPLWTSGTSIGDSLLSQIGTTIDVNGKLYADQIQLSGGTGDQGLISWNADEETIDIIQNGATLQVGQEIQIHCKNQTGSTIPDGTPVYVTGTLGASGRLTIAPMIANGTIPAKYFIGITTEPILDGDDGKVTFFGKIRGLDTSAYAEGQTLWVSATNAGLFQTTRPVAPNLDLEVAIVINSHVNNGTIFVRSNIGHYLADAHDVAISSLTDGDSLIYSATNQRWENQQVDSDKFYLHDQNVASATWVVNHNLNKYPSATIVDSLKNQVFGEISYTNLNSLTITFVGAFSGQAYLN